MARLAARAGAVALVAAAVLALWPLSGAGLSGNAVRPVHGDFGWSTYAPLPTGATTADLREAGVPVPQDVVAARRRAVAAVAVVGVVLLLAGVGADRLRR